MIAIRWFITHSKARRIGAHWFHAIKVAAHLDALGESAQRVDVLLAEVVELAVGLLGRGLHHQRRIEELVELGREELEGEVRVLSEHLRRGEKEEGGGRVRRGGR